MKSSLKSSVFPNALPDLTATDAANAVVGSNLDPIDCPWGSRRGRLCELMTSLDPHVKRCSAELLFALCDDDGKRHTDTVLLHNDNDDDVPCISSSFLFSLTCFVCGAIYVAHEFVARTGLGNAIALLQTKGVL